MSTTLNIVDVRRIAAANRTTEQRVVKAAGELGIALHAINDRRFADVNDEQRIEQHLHRERHQCL